MASDESIRKMIHAIMDKRRELGIPDWGLVPPEDVIQRLNRTPDPASPAEEPSPSPENSDPPHAED